MQSDSSRVADEQFVLPPTGRPSTGGPQREGLAKEDGVPIGELTKRLVGWRKHLGFCTEDNMVLRQGKKVLQRQLAELAAKVQRYEQLAQRLQNLMPKE